MNFDLSMSGALCQLLGRNDFPPRWHCGNWSALHGWTHIISDVLIWLAYVTIPIILLYFARERKDVPFPRIFFLFAAFILSCGTVHFIEAVIFWWPIYRVAAVVKVFTAIVSVSTVLALFSIIPKALELRSPLELKREVEERQKVEVELQEALNRIKLAQSSYIQNERLKALGQMAGGIAHNISNSLAPAVSFCDVLSSELDVPEQQHRLSLIKKSIQDAATTVQRLQDFSKIDKESGFEVCDLNTLSRDICVLARQTAFDAGRNIQITLGAQEQPIPVKGNPTLLREAIMNLVLNAVDAVSDETGWVKVTSSFQSDQALLEVSDNGRGMSPKEQEECLNPFFTTKDESGLGLGLTTVSKTVDIHRGQLLVDTTPGEGTTFGIKLPLASSQKEETLTEVGQPSFPVGLRILLVEDHTGVSEAMVEALSIDEHLVDVARSKDEALVLVEGSQPGYDVVITDYSLKEGTGIQLVDGLREKALCIPVIMLTGYANFLSQDEVAKVDNLLPKPANIESLRTALREVLSRSDKTL